MTDERIRHSWNANAAAWTDAVRERRIESRRLGTDDAIVAAVRALQPRTVFDLGCGEGWLARALAAHGMAVTGIDGSAELIEAAQQLGGASFRHLSYDGLIADSASFDVKFDAVVANFSLFDETLEPILTAARDLLAPAGAMLIQTLHPAGAAAPYTDGWRVETFRDGTGTWPEPMPWYFRTLSSWIELFERAGLTLRATREPLHPETRQPLSIIFLVRP